MLVTGIDAGRVTAWFLEQVPCSRAPLRFELVAGGRSNLTFRATDAGGRTFVLRRPPLGNVLASAHDMGREFRILSALAGGPVPVPTPAALCTDESVNGPPFYVMEHVDGHVLRDATVMAELFPEERREHVSFALIDVLADLHAIDPDTVGLGQLGRKEGYIERQLRRWERQWQQSKTRELPAVDEVHRRLSGRIPTQERPAIVHGDFRIDNVIYDSGGDIRAVLDWELCTLGDPLADLGGLLVSWVQHGEAGDHTLVPSATALPGIPTREQVIKRYAERSGLNVADVRFYVAFGFWKLACIGEGVYARYRAGAMGGDEDLQIDRVRDQVVTLANAAVATLEAP
jgi:aminoglycoside phosphotransferase (APT) family kinase protein